MRTSSWMTLVSMVVVFTSGDFVAYEPVIDIAHGGEALAAQPRKKPSATSSGLIDAAYNGDTSTVSNLLARGANVHETNQEGATALMAAAIKGHTEVAKILVRKGADINARDNQGWTAVVYASQNGHLEMVKFLLENGAQADLTTRDGGTALTYAEGNGHQEVVALIKTYRSRPESSTSASAQAVSKPQQLTSVGKLAQAIRREAAQLQGTREKPQKETRTATAKDKELLEAIVSDSSVPEIELILAQGGDPNSRNSSGDSALTLAASKGKSLIVELLLKKGADVNVRDSSGRTPLWYAADSEPLLDILLHAGADANARNQDGCTVLMHAAELHKLKIVQKCVSSGADVNAKDNQGRTSLMYAMNEAAHPLQHSRHARKMKDAAFMLVVDSSEDTPRTLISNGADVNARDRGGRSVLMYAAKTGNMALVRLLLKQGADATVKDNKGKDVFYFVPSSAIEDGYGSSSDISKMLKAHIAEEKLKAINQQ